MYNYINYIYIYIYIVYTLKTRSLPTNTGMVSQDISSTVPVFLVTSPLVTRSIVCALAWFGAHEMPSAHPAIPAFPTSKKETGLPSLVVPIQTCVLCTFWPTNDQSVKFWQHKVSDWCFQPCSIGIAFFSIRINYNILLTWIKAIWGWCSLLTMIPVRSQWGRYNSPRCICMSCHSRTSWHVYKCETTYQLHLRPRILQLLKNLNPSASSRSKEGTSKENGFSQQKWW